MNIVILKRDDTFCLVTKESQHLELAHNLIFDILSERDKAYFSGTSYKSYPYYRPSGSEYRLYETNIDIDIRSDLGYSDYVNVLNNFFEKVIVVENNATLHDYKEIEKMLDSNSE